MWTKNYDHYSQGHAFYVVANQHNIIRVVLVQANTWFTEHYVTALYRAFCNEGLGWINTGRVPKLHPNVFNSELEYVVDQHTVDHLYQLHKSLFEMYTKKRIPIPPIHRCLPSSVALWNKCKGPIDLYSRILRNNQPTQNKITKIGSTWLRMIRTAVYNAYMVQIMLICNAFLQNTAICKSWRHYVKHRTKIAQTEGGSFQCFIGNLGEELDHMIKQGNDTWKSKTVSKNEIGDNKENEKNNNVVLCNRNENENTMMYNRRALLFHDFLLNQRRRQVLRNHDWIKIPDNSGKRKQLRCVWCCGKNHTQTEQHSRQGRKTTYMCVVCDVPLCKVVRVGQRRSCFEQFHTAKKLNNPCRCSGSM